MTLGYSTNVAATAWLRDSTNPGRLITIGPPGFGAYGRLRFIRDPVGAGEAEVDVELPSDHSTDAVQTLRALRHLVPFTDSLDDCFFLAWQGYPDFPIPDRPPVESVVRLPDREYWLMRGSLSDLAGWSSQTPPAFIWPADQAWCFTSDVDPHWAGVGASAEAIDVLTAADDVDVVRMRAGEDPPRFT